MHRSDIRHIAVIGAGRMGHGIGQTFARAGYPVVLCDVSEDKLQEAVHTIQYNLQELAECGVIVADQIRSTLDRVGTTTSLNEAVQDVQWVVETVVEDIELKQSVFRELDAICPEPTILSSNTSSFVPSSLASVTNRPDRVLATHFFYPAHLMPLVEIAPGDRTSRETIDTVCSVLKSAGKSPVVLRKEAVGHIANRLQMAILREALNIVELGIATPQDVDTVAKESFGRRLAIAGPFEMAEMQTTCRWDGILWQLRYFMPHLSSSVEDSPLLLHKVAQGKTKGEMGGGFYEWTSESIMAARQGLRQALIEFLCRPPAANNNDTRRPA